MREGVAQRENRSALPFGVYQPMIALMGRVDTPTDGVDDYCNFLGQAILLACVARSYGHRCQNNGSTSKFRAPAYALSADPIPPMSQISTTT